jgi:putative acetyltransferase
MPPATLRAYRAVDEDAAIALWRRTWQIAYPDIDFAARTPWWRERWRTRLVAFARVAVAERGDALAGFVTIDATGYLDQLVVAPEEWGSPVAGLLCAEARRLSPSGVSLKVNADNARAIGFYRKQGFRVAGDDVNPLSGRAARWMVWRPD